MNEVQCKKLYSLEHWQGNDLVSSYCAFYVLFTNGDCLKASYNDESCIWEVTGVRQTLISHHLMGMTISVIGMWNMDIVMIKQLVN
jgi:hypothetical protein